MAAKRDTANERYEEQAKKKNGNKNVCSVNLPTKLIQLTESC